MCKAIHANKADPELMTQDYEGFPRQWYNEGFMSEYNSDAVDNYMEFNDSLDDFEEADCGEWIEKKTTLVT